MPTVLRTTTICALCLLCGARAGVSQDTAKPKNVDQLLSSLDRVESQWQDYQVSGNTEAAGKQQPFKVYFKKPNLVRIDSKDGQVSVQPNGDIRGRLGHGIFGKISRKLDRNDKRLQDDEGIPFYQSDFPDMVARIRDQVKKGAAATMSDEHDTFGLEIHAGDTVWKYTFDKSHLTFQENSRWVKGKQIECTHYTDFRANSGLKTDLFKF